MKRPIETVILLAAAKHFTDKKVKLTEEGCWLAKCATVASLRLWNKQKGFVCKKSR